MSKAARLNALNNALTAAEGHLFNLNLGARASVALVGLEGAELIWGKFDDGEWGLIVRSANGQLRRILEASIDERVASAHVLPALLVAVHEAATENLKKIDDAIEAAWAFVKGQ